MTRHLIRLIWNRKRQNFLLIVEILCSFLALFGVLLFAVNFANNARLPLGYSVDRLWSISVDRKESDRDPAVKARMRQTYQQLLVALQDLPEIERVAAAYTAPYTNSSWGGRLRTRGGQRVEFYLNTVTDDFPALFQMPLIAGRWFSREDDAATDRPVILNRRMAAAIFGSTNPIGQIVHEERDPDDPPADPDQKPEIKRVIGVMEDFRQMGELSSPQNFLFYRLRVDDPDPKAALPDLLLVRLRPGTTAAFEETLVRRASAIARDWSFEVSPFDAMRESKLRQYSVPLTIVAIVAGFLLLMVALGLTGVVWQSVTQRIREFGLRRAKGASAVDVQRQVLVEMIIMTSLALLVGVAMVAQLALLPIPGKLGIIPPGVFVTSLAISVAAIYLLTLLCGWYPSRLATKVPPSEALHYE